LRELKILSIVLASVLGVILGIIALVFAVKQQKLSRNVWGRRGKILAIVGIILSIIVIAVNIYIAQNPEVLTQLLGISTLPY
jgi:vacuolar-type H+-ATPase subunit I/STV1